MKKFKIDIVNISLESTILVVNLIRFLPVTEENSSNPYNSSVLRFGSMNKSLRFPEVKIFSPGLDK